MNMIYLGSDHGGFHLKEKIKEWLKEWGYKFEDLGNTVYNKEDDYPVFAFRVAKRVAEEQARLLPIKIGIRRGKGILCCRSAAGMVMAANKIKGIRASAAFNKEAAKQARLHNDANILAIGADYLPEKEIKEIIKVWLETEFSGEERHVRRLKMIEELDGK